MLCFYLNRPQAEYAIIFDEELDRIFLKSILLAPDASTQGTMSALKQKFSQCVRTLITSQNSCCDLPPTSVMITVVLFSEPFHSLLKLHSMRFQILSNLLSMLGEFDISGLTIHDYSCSC